MGLTREELDTFSLRSHERALDAVSQNSEIFQGMPDSNELSRFLRKRLQFVRVSPGQTIFEQGDWADNFFVVRLGHVRIGISQGGYEQTVLYRGPGTVLGEIGLLAISPRDAAKSTEELDAALAEVLTSACTMKSSVSTAPISTTNITGLLH